VDLIFAVEPRVPPRPGGPIRPPKAIRTMTVVSEDIGRSYEIPEDPAARPRRRRRAVRVIVIGPDGRVLLFEDSDPGIPGVTWWVTPGGGMDPGETERQTAVREVAEETGYLLTEDDLVGPLATRYAVHGYSDQVLEQDESFYLARVDAFEIDTTAHTAEEQITLQGHRWWTRAEIAAGEAWIWPAELLQLCDRAAHPQLPALDLGRQQESTVDV
jgi:8-oxo-dGTP pyrophosphatase MutT (NUDIX family)